MYANKTVAVVAVVSFAMRKTYKFVTENVVVVVVVAWKLSLIHFLVSFEP